mgnify:FL=1
MLFRSNLKAWNKLEELLDECSDKQQSSGGYMNNPQANPQVLPLFAVKKMGNEYKVFCFLQSNDGQQNTVGSFVVDKFEYDNNNVFQLDWSNQSIPDFFKCVMVFKRFDKVVYEEDSDTKVFLFIPTNIASNNPEDGDNVTNEYGNVDKTKEQRKAEGKDKGEPQELQQPKEPPTEPYGTEPSQEEPKGQEPPQDIPSEDEPKGEEPTEKKKRGRKKKAEPKAEAKK